MISELICRTVAPIINGIGITIDEIKSENLSFLFAIMFLSWLTANIKTKKETDNFKISWLNSYFSKNMFQSVMKKLYSNRLMITAIIIAIVEISKDIKTFFCDLNQQCLLKTMNLKAVLI